MQKVLAVLAAKVHPPRRAGGTLPRTRLIDALHEHVDCKLQLVVAPAGFGKTTLLVDFVHEAAFATCWATLDATDRDVAGFLETVVAALRRRFPTFGARTLAALHSAPDVERRTSALARLLAAEVEERVDAFTVLVLDDYHEVNDSVPVTQLVDELLRLLPDNLRLVLAGRTLPSLTVSRLIVAGQLFGLGEADLRFTSGELLTLLRRRGQAVGPEQAVALAEGAEGWIAGFLLSVPRLWDGLVGGMIAAGGGEGPLYDYLAAEAFDRQPPDVQRFLLATAVPATPDADLCAALLGPGNWLAMLDRVEGAGLFVTRLRTGRDAFRYHQLFRRFLQARLRRMDPAAYARLQAAAAVHLAGRGAWQEALTHFREGGQDAEAAALVARIAPELERTSRWRLLADAVAGLPPEGAAAYPALLLSGARAALLMGDLVRAEALSEAARAAGVRLGDRMLEAWGLAYLGSVRRLQGRTAEALVVLQRARSLAPTDEELLANIRRDAGQCLGVQGDFAGAAAELREALAYFDRTGATYEAARTEFPLGVALVKSGRIAEAIGRYESALSRWRRLGDTAMEAEMHNCLGCAYAYRGDYPRARAELQEALARARDDGYPLTQAATLHSLGEVLLAAGEIDDARAAFEQGLAIAQEIGELWMVTQLYDGLALTSALAGDLVRAEEHAHHAIALAQRQDSRYLEAVCSLTLGAVQSRTGRPEVLRTLQAATEALAAMEARREAARGQLWLAQAQHRAGATAAARHHLRTALCLAQDLGSDGIFDLHARWDPALFRGAVAEGIERLRLVAVLGCAGTTLPAVQPAPPAALPALAVRAFGPGTLLIDGTRDVDWGWDKSRELFFLLLHGGPRRQEQLLAALWPDSPPARAKSALHTAVYRLRRAVHPQVILLRGGAYRINEELVTWYDVREFERLLQAALVASGDEAAMLLQQAVDLCTAPFLADLDAEWCVEERERLERRHLVALEHLSDAHAAAGRPRESIAAAERLLALDPLREDVHARIIRAYLRLGDRGAARRQLERCTSTLRDELGILPGPELQALGKRIGA